MTAAPATTIPTTDVPAAPAVKKKTISFRKAVAIAASTAAIVIVGLMVTAASYSSDVIHVPVRTILDISPSAGAMFETDLAQGAAEQQVGVNGQYVHSNLDTLQVTESGWQLTKTPLDPKSPIQAYDLTPVK